MNWMNWKQIGRIAHVCIDDDKSLCVSLFWDRFWLSIRAFQKGRNNGVWVRVPDEGWGLAILGRTGEHLGVFEEDRPRWTVFGFRIYVLIPVARYDEIIQKRFADLSSNRV